jgi:exopolysaccharide biosynthesis protein
MWWLASGEGGAPPDTSFYAGSVFVMARTSPRMIVVRVPDTLVFLYDPRNVATVDSIARRENLRCAINGSFFSGIRGNASHAGLLALYGLSVSPALVDRQLTHVVRIHSAAHAIEFFPAKSFADSLDPRTVEFQTGPMVIEGGNVREDLIRSSINGMTKHTRTLIAALDHKDLYFVTVTEPVALDSLASSLLRISAFRGRRLDVVNLDGGSSVALYLKDAPGWNYNAGDRLPVLIGFH